MKSLRLLGVHGGRHESAEASKGYARLLDLVEPPDDRRRRHRRGESRGGRAEAGEKVEGPGSRRRLADVAVAHTDLAHVTSCRSPRLHFPRPAHESTGPGSRHWHAMWKWLTARKDLHGRLDVGLGDLGVVGLRGRPRRLGPRPLRFFLGPRLTKVKSDTDGGPDVGLLLLLRLLAPQRQVKRQTMATRVPLMTLLLRPRLMCDAMRAGRLRETRTSQSFSAPRPN